MFQNLPVTFRYRINTNITSFSVNYRLTLHHVQVKTFCMRSIGWAFTEAIMGGGGIFDTGPFVARQK